MIVLDKQSDTEYAANTDLHIYKYCILFRGSDDTFYDVYFQYSELNMVIKLCKLIGNNPSHIYLYEPKYGSISYLPNKEHANMLSVITDIRGREFTTDTVIKSLE